jgi:hypothetical protein
MSEPPALPDPAGSHRNRPKPPTDMAQLWFALTGPTMSCASGIFLSDTPIASDCRGSAGVTKQVGRAMLSAVAI